jgi:hypothetical protein
MNAAQLHTRSCRSDSVIWEITLVVTLSSLIVFGTLATIIKMDDDLIAVESTTQSATLPDLRNSTNRFPVSGPSTKISQFAL